MLKELGAYPPSLKGAELETLEMSVGVCSVYGRRCQQLELSSNGVHSLWSELPALGLRDKRLWDSVERELCSV